MDNHVYVLPFLSTNVRNKGQDSAEITGNGHCTVIMRFIHFHGAREKKMLSTAMTSILSWWFQFATGYKVCSISQNHSQLLVQVDWWNLLLQRLDLFSFLVPLQTLVIGINIHFCYNYFPHKRCSECHCIFWSGS